MGHIAILEALHAKDPKLDFNLEEGSRKTPMMYAHGGKQSTETILWLLEHGADPNASIDENGISLLQAACIFGRFQLAKAYIRAGADCNKKWSRSLQEALTPLERCCIVTSAATGPSIECTKNYEYRERKPEKDAYSRAPDSEDDRLELIALMIQKGVEIRRSKPEEGSFEPSPMVFAAENHLISVMEILIKAGAGVGDIDHRKKFPILALIMRSIAFVAAEGIRLLNKLHRNLNLADG
ncbi:hypothetical protein KJ359_003171 [Pestalotiopsis sp. 9143b]|nr:hypothetical protein KJ359_003171 [Pestalotiopsis sp. 9143b]